MSFKRQAIGLVTLLALCFGTAALGSLATYPRIESWYATLAKPSWTPPGWIFGPVWSCLYLSMAIAAWLVWRQRGFRAAAGPLSAFGVQLGLNAAWSWLFFGLMSPGLAFLEIIPLLLAILVTVVLFLRRSTLAGVLLLPYLAWVSFASLLNLAIWRLNG